MPAFLVPVNPGQMLIPLEKAVVLIGRQADCDVSLTHSRKISRKHCCIAQVNNTFVVRDLGSTNGVFVNGSRIEKEALISMGDDLIIGDIHFRVQSDTTLAPKKKAAKNVAEYAKPVEQPVSVQPVAPPAKNIALDTSPSMDEEPKVAEELKPVEKLVKQTALPHVRSRPSPSPEVLKNVSEQVKPVEKPVGEHPLPIQNRPAIMAQTIDGPFAIPEGDNDFEVEVTKANAIPAPRKVRIDDVVPLNDNDNDSNDEVFRLASDSF